MLPVSHDFHFCLSCGIRKDRESCLSHLILLQCLAQCLSWQHQWLKNTVQNVKHGTSLINTWMGFHHLISECLLSEESHCYFSHSPQLLPFFLCLCLVVGGGTLSASGHFRAHAGCWGIVKLYFFLGKDPSGTLEVYFLSSADVSVLGLGFQWG